MNTKQSLSLFILTAALAGGFCNARATETKATLADSLVPAESESATFNPVLAKLDIGGGGFGYLDMQGRMEALGREMNDLFQNLAGLSPEFGAGIPFLAGVKLDPLLQETGLYNLEALGFSSRPDGKQFINKEFYYMPEGRSGLFGVTGGEAHAFRATSLAPVGADVFVSVDMNIPAVAKTFEAVMVRALGDAGKNIFDNAMAEPVGDKAAMTMGELIGLLNTRLMVSVEFGESFELPEAEEPFNVPSIELLMAMENVSQEILDLIPEEEREGMEQWGNYLMLHAEEPQSIGAQKLDPTLVFDSRTNRVWFTLNADYFKKVAELKSSLADDLEFNLTLRGLPQEGNSLVYLSPEFFKHLVDVRERGIKLFPPASVILTFYALYMPILYVDDVGEGSAMVLVNEPHGIFLNSRLPYDNATMFTGGNQQFVTIGLLAAIAVPASNKVRENAQEKAIQNNLRMIASAAQQYMLEELAEEVSYDQLTPTYFSPIESVNGEDYSSIVITADSEEISVTDADGIVHSHQF